MVREYKYKIGSRAQVMHGIAKMTGGGLIKKQLKYNKHGKIVSRKASRAAKKSKNLVKAGYITKKGQFGVVKKERDTMNGGFLKRSAYFTTAQKDKFKEMKSEWGKSNLDNLTTVLKGWINEIKNGNRNMIKIIKYFFLTNSRYSLQNKSLPDYFIAFFP